MIASESTQAAPSVEQTRSGSKMQQRLPVFPPSRLSMATFASAHFQDFKPNRSLLNSKFEGYKFNPLPQDNLIRRYGLQYKPSQTGASASRLTQPMSFQEVQSRITHNHLTIRPDSAIGVYVDAEHRVIGVAIDPVSRSLSVLSRLEQPQS